MAKYIKGLVLAGLFLATLFLSACGQAGREISYNKKIISTTFSAYDWACNVVGATEGYDLLYLTKSGVDLHSFNPTSRDITDIATADLVIYIGGPSDQWVKDAIKNKVNPKQQVICLMDFLKNQIVEEELVEGMTEKEEEEEGIEYDEHVWMSLDNASLVTKEIASILASIDSPNASTFESNAVNYTDKLTSLKADFQGKMQERTKDTILVCDRFPFRYLFDEFDLKYYAAFPGCSAESEAGFDTVVFLSNKVDELNLSFVCVLENSPGQISKVVLDTAKKKDVEVLTLNSLQSISLKDIEVGASYISIMEDNLKTISLLTK